MKNGYMERTIAVIERNSWRERYQTGQVSLRAWRVELLESMAERGKAKVGPAGTQGPIGTSHLL